MLADDTESLIEKETHMHAERDPATYLRKESPLA